MENLKTAAIVQVRLNSLRLPDKPLLKIYNETLLSYLLKRISKCKNIDMIILAIPRNKKNLKLKNYIKKTGYRIYEGSEEDLLSRYYYAAKKYKVNTIVRLTSDCPFHDPKLIDKAIKLFHKKKLDLLCNYDPPSFPDGYDLSITNFNKLSEAFKKSTSHKEREHVMPYLLKLKNIKKFNIKNKKNYSNIRVTIDERQDYELAVQLSKKFKNNKFFNFPELIKLYESNRDFFKINSHIPRDEGSLISTEQKIWKRAKQIIPGGNMLFTKRPERFLPGYWPTYFSKAKGINVWSTSGKKYIDLSLMGVGTNILGYANPKINSEVKKALNKGNISTLNSHEEVLLAEKLIAIHPWADMARFTRSGGEANAVAIRIARAFKKKDGVAICGYHGWHDWYLAANLKNKKTLNSHLLTNLNISGVPKILQSTIFPFKYNNFRELKNIILKNPNIGIVKMEVFRNIKPQKDFLTKVRKLCDKKKLVLIFDECTSGFRQTFGGLHKLYNVEPDIAIFGKALGNGYPINAIIGRRDIMNACQSSFISSTFWTERLGSVAALKTLELMEKEKSWEKISSMGRYLKKKWLHLLEKYNFKASVTGLDAMPKINFLSKNKLIYKTYITQEMLKKGYLTDDAVYLSTLHSKEIIDNYLKSLEKVFKKIKALKTARNIKKNVIGEICHDNFKRLN